MVYNLSLVTTKDVGYKDGIHGLFLTLNKKKRYFFKNEDQAIQCSASVLTQMAVKTGKP